MLGTIWFVGSKEKYLSFYYNQETMKRITVLIQVKVRMVTFIHLYNKIRVNSRKIFSDSSQSDNGDIYIGLQ